jgi:hypothetical protein
MDLRKAYVRPAIDSEEMLEQTSLACNAVMIPEPSPILPNCGPGLEMPCNLALVKGGNWDPNMGCTSQPLEGTACAVQYS